MSEVDWDAYIEQAARLLDLTLTPEMQGATRDNLATAERMANRAQPRFYFARCP